MKTFKIFRANNQYLLIAKTDYASRTTVYDNYPANVINILKNIGYTEYREPTMQERASAQMRRHVASING